jgi:hypothetical protein
MMNTVPPIVCQHALRVRLGLLCSPFPGERYLDIGTPENLAKAVRQFSQLE